MVRHGVDALLHRKYGGADEDFSVAVGHYKSTVSLPIHCGLTDGQVALIIEEVNQFEFDR